MRLHLRNPIRANCHGTPLLPGDQPGNGIEGTNSTIAQLKGLLMNLVCPKCQEAPMQYAETWYRCPCKAFGCAIINNQVKGYDFSREPYALKSWWMNKVTCLYKHGALSPILIVPYISITSQEELDNLLYRLQRLLPFA